MGESVPQYKYGLIVKIDQVEADFLFKKMKEVILSLDEHRKMSKYLFKQCLRKDLSDEDYEIFYDYYFFDSEILLNLLIEWKTYGNKSYSEICDQMKDCNECIKEIVAWFGLKHSQDISKIISSEDFEKAVKLVFSNSDKLKGIFCLKVNENQDSQIDDRQKVLKLINLILKEWSNVKLVKKRRQHRDGKSRIDLPVIYKLELLSRDDEILLDNMSLFEILEECEDLDLLIQILLDPPAVRKFKIKLRDV